MRLKPWPIEVAALAGGGAGALLALWSEPERATWAMAGLRGATVIGASLAFALAMTTIRNRYLR